MNSVYNGDIGYTLEGFLNHPFSDRIAARVVAWYRKDAGYIDNIPGSRTYPSSGITINNADPNDSRYDLAEANYNDVYTYGARAALKIELNDNWTVTPQIMGQSQKAYGSFAEESGLDDLQIMQFQQGKNQRQMGPGRADRRRQDRQFRHDLCRRLHEAAN